VQYYEPETPLVTLAYASPARRLLASFIDYLLVSFLVAPITGPAVGHALSRSSPQVGDVMGPALVFLMANLVYSTALHAWRGSTYGKMAARLVLVNDDGSPVTLAGAFVRGVALTAIFFSSFFVVLPIILDMLRPLWNARRQTWHDQIARTVVVLNSPR
jgi:uncharacterized RDD family membrane protein YckC